MADPTEVMNLVGIDPLWPSVLSSRTLCLGPFPSSGPTLVYALVELMYSCGPIPRTTSASLVHMMGLTDDTADATDVRLPENRPRIYLRTMTIESLIP